jgi:erythromycin esterase-like protein
MAADTLEARLREARRPLRSDAELDPLLERIGDARVVLLGEASHGTHGFYTSRHRISERLIHERGFDFIAVEGDWPDCYRVNHYVRGAPDAGASAREVLHAFDRWPTWMWANRDTEAPAEALRRINDERDPEERVGFYGLVLPLRYDALLYIDESRALQPLHLEAHEDGEPPETYPFAV